MYVFLSYRATRNFHTCCNQLVSKNQIRTRNNTTTIIHKTHMSNSNRDSKHVSILDLEGEKTPLQEAPYLSPILGRPK